ncbi:FAD/NAD-P-binding domain-containing protein [Rhodofomes roseus]|uniref:FAD/NAD-P-binding domain-containing protein n=1 Tax=Rhodofomes roseus TaxID=34475 RepID=A0ABQ8KMS9_9APHY|nr:FAD/NAD-P-binding domain-containing protein [Rhodofomes roseus]KAH9839368.1 FAD/NAD-P-binding domain-containing protein [Rhodofomes roseus]
MPGPKFRVAICGGGIGGLCLAVALSKHSDIQVDLYEAAARFKEIGAGVMIWSRTWEILTLLGLDGKFAEIAHAPPDGSDGVGFDYRKSDQPEEGHRFYFFERPYGCIRFHRAQFLDVFVDALPEGVDHFGKRLISYSQTSSDTPVELHFSDNTSAVCDVLIGCDGIKSTIRKQMLEEKARMGQKELLRNINPIWTGTTVYRGLIPVDRLKALDGKEHRTIETPMMYCGKHKHVVSYSISKRSIVNVVACTSRPDLEGSTYRDGEPWVVDCTQEELLDCYNGWEPEVVEMLKCIEKPTRWGIHHLRPLPMYVSNKVALLGDAVGLLSIMYRALSNATVQAHAMSPHQGAGAGHAIEDAFILAHLLGHHSITLARLPQALLAYEHVRLPLANHVLRGSYESGKMYEFDGPQGDSLQGLGPALEKQWDWLDQTTPTGEADRAVERLEDMVQNE